MSTWETSDIFITFKICRDLLFTKIFCYIEETGGGYQEVATFYFICWLGLACSLRITKSNIEQI